MNTIFVTRNEAAYPYAIVWFFIRNCFASYAIVSVAYVIVSSAGPDFSRAEIALAADEDSGTLQISKLYLKISCRGCGIGREVLAFIEDQCGARGVRELWLTVNKDNGDSIAFYKRVGFVIAEAMITDIGNGFVMDDYRLVKSLESPRP